MSKDFLNIGIIGGETEADARRGFRKMKTEKIQRPKYDPNFFEAFPTMWAGAFSFERALQQKEFVEIEEWAVLLSLHFFGVMHLETFERETLIKEYDWDLWKALSITYPFGNINLTEVDLLKIDRLVVGAYYPSTIFFPSRGRSTWLHSVTLKPYLKGKKLSWEKLSKLHLDNEKSQEELHRHLRSVIQFLDGDQLKTGLEKFCQDYFGDFDGDLKNLVPHPRNWETYGNRLTNQEDLLEAYPLKKNNNGKTTYYLLTDMPTLSSWMTLPLGNGLPASTAYSKSPRNNEILVSFAGKLISCAIAPDDEIKFLKDFFLPHPPFWCKVTDGNFVAKVMPFNQVSINSPDRDKDDKAYCLLPVKSNFLSEFPETFDEKIMRQIKAEPLVDEEVLWRIPICNKIVEISFMPEINSNMQKATVEIYPPKVSPRWKVYAAYGSILENTGNWHLIDEQGQKGKTFLLKNDEYISVSHSDAGPNRPRALVYIDGNDSEGGVLILNQTELKDNPADRPESAKLALDFGTSNTCLSYGLDKKGEVMRFTLSPLLIWGEPSNADSPGFVPKRWGGERGFFPTLLFSRRKFQELSRIKPSQLQLEHLFQVDLPSLHKGIEQSVILGDYENNYEAHLNLKWGKESSEPWRSLFLRNVLFYAHAELFFNKTAVPNEYVFTYPLAFDREAQDNYKKNCKEATEWIRKMCFDSSLITQKTNFYEMDESTAIAKSINQEGQKNLLEIFIDIGGGTADIAIRHEDKFVVLDSVRVAGEAFFDFTEKNFSKPNLIGADELRRNLGLLLLGNNIELNLSTFGEKFKDNLGASYSCVISQLNDDDFISREAKIIPQDKTSSDEDEDISYQRYRSKLFFKHIFLYTLVQACAFAASSDKTSSNRIHFILGGNGWGLLLFAGWKRSKNLLEYQVKQLLELLKDRFALIGNEENKTMIDKINNLQVSDVDLLNYESLSDVKTCVSLGALEARTVRPSELGETAPFAGITVEDLKINEYERKDINWYERWNLDTLQAKLKDEQGRNAIFETITKVDIEQPDEISTPLDEILSVFLSIGNESDLRTDNMPKNEWTKMNGALIEEIKNMRANYQRLTDAPINEFLTKVLYPMKNYDYLDVLAETNGIKRK